jgi:CRISPR-associated endonuclease/helicase Cas3
MRNYWGKASSNKGKDFQCHLLAYHSLDVTAVAAYWWDNHPVIRRLFLSQSNLTETEYRAWLLFFIALHDLGKFDIRFQCKADAVWLMLNPEQRGIMRPSFYECKGFDHGQAGLYWFVSDSQVGDSMDMGSLSALLGEPQEHPYASWLPWLEAVTGHHGWVIGHERVQDVTHVEYQDQLAADKAARIDWLNTLETLFLIPAGLSIQDYPPQKSALLAGFCSVSDWLGSWRTDDTFQFCADIYESADDLQAYFQQKYATDARIVLARSGLLNDSKSYTDISALLSEGYRPRQLQTLVNSLPVKPGLTIVEAPTGSGKTETAMAYAWRLLDAGLADSIVFALPTQATANAMLKRMPQYANHLFINPNVTLAHCNAKFNEDFQAIRQSGSNIQHEEEAWAQCCQWLSQSRKRVFLGQIGVCTVDQVLVSVLPVKHRFIRGFGVGRSVLIIDEVHAYDSYMSGLLNQVLSDQFQSGGSAILLSATLPEPQKQKLVDAWSGESATTFPDVYPLVTWRDAAAPQFFDLEETPAQKPKPFSVQLQPMFLPDSLPDASLLNEIVQAARQDAQVCIICNLVDAAQQLYEQLKNMTDHQVLLFHARYTLVDRNQKEQNVLALFGPEGDRSTGRILVSTQVIEQSLNVDFDWLITQLCPADLLFQRLGRLHRFDWPVRPKAFSDPVATVLLPAEAGFGRYQIIYANTRVMWKTRKRILALNGEPLHFPAAYRDWIKEVYNEKPDDDEPAWVIKACDEFEKDDLARRSKARNMLQQAKTIKPYSDDDENIRAVTRDGEMSLPVILYEQVGEGRALLDGQILEQLDELERAEALALNRINVPETWEGHFLENRDDDGVIWLEVQRQGQTWVASGKRCEWVYSNEVGMKKILYSDAIENKK